MERLQFLRSLKALETLDLSSCRTLTDQALEPLADIRASLLKLDLSKCHFTGTGLQHIAGSQKLIILNLNDCHGLLSKELLHLQNVDSLEHLYLNNCTMMDGKAIQFLTSMKSLLTLSCKGWKEFYSDDLRSLPQLRNLQFLDLSQCRKFNIEGLAHLKGLNLRTLKLSNSPWIDETLFSYLQPLAHSLVELDLSFCPRLHDFGPHIASLLGSVHTLHLRGCTGFKASDFAQISSLISLTTLDLGEIPHITDAVLKALGELIHLKKLSLEQCEGITCEGLMLLKDLAEFRQ